jgi:hypothetical protein
MDLRNTSEKEMQTSSLNFSPNIEIAPAFFASCKLQCQSICLHVIQFSLIPLQKGGDGTVGIIELSP